MLTWLGAGPRPHRVLCPHPSWPSVPGCTHILLTFSKPSPHGTAPHHVAFLLPRTVLFSTVPKPWSDVIPCNYEMQHTLKDLVPLKAFLLSGTVVTVVEEKVGARAPQGSYAAPVSCALLFCRASVALLPHWQGLCAFPERSWLAPSPPPPARLSPGLWSSRLLQTVPWLLRRAKQRRTRRRRRKTRKTRRAKTRQAKGRRSPPRYLQMGAAAWVGGGCSWPLPSPSTHLASLHRRKKGARSRRSFPRSCTRPRPSCGCSAAARWS